MNDMRTLMNLFESDLTFDDVFELNFRIAKDRADFVSKNSKEKKGDLLIYIDIPYDEWLEMLMSIYPDAYKSDMNPPDSTVLMYYIEINGHPKLVGEFSELSADGYISYIKNDDDLFESDLSNDEVFELNFQILRSKADYLINNDTVLTFKDISYEDWEKLVETVYPDARYHLPGMADSDLTKTTSYINGVSYTVGEWRFGYKYQGLGQGRIFYIDKGE